MSNHPLAAAVSSGANVDFAGIGARAGRAKHPHDQDPPTASRASGDRLRAAVHAAAGDRTSGVAAATIRLWPLTP